MNTFIIDSAMTFTFIIISSCIVALLVGFLFRRLSIALDYPRCRRNCQINSIDCDGSCQESYKQFRKDPIIDAVLILSLLLLLSDCKDDNICTVTGRYADGTSETFEVVLEGDTDKFCEGAPLVFNFTVIDQCYCK